MIYVAGEGPVADRVLEVLASTDQWGEIANDRVVGGEVEVAVAAGEAGLVDLVSEDLDVPVLPVGVELGWPALRADDVGEAVGWLATGEYETEQHRILDVEVAGEAVGRTLFDAMLVRSEPGRISEYGVAGGGERTRFRADGVVLATPAGSRGYAHAVGGPRLAGRVDAVVIVPVGAFALGADVLVIDPAGGLHLSIERDAGAVSLLLDGREVRTLGGRATVDLLPGGSLEVIVRPARSPLHDS